MARILIGNIKGPQGIPGPKGDKGDTGAAGPAGPAGAVDNATPIEFTEAAQRANLVSGDSIATLFGKQKKWNADMKDVTFSGVADHLKINEITRNTNLNSVFESGFYRVRTSAVAQTLENCPTTIAFSMVVVGDAVSSPVYCYQSLTEYHSSQGKKFIRFYYDGEWSDWKQIYTEINPPTPADIGAASVGELTGCWGLKTLSSPGWYRVAKIEQKSTGQVVSCDISIAKTFNTVQAEDHNVKLINSYNESIFKAVYDKTQSIKSILKIRNVTTGPYSNYYIDFYYNSSYSNLVRVILDKAIDSRGIHWEMVDFVPVPETAAGETVLAELEFEANSWLGGSL